MLQCSTCGLAWSRDAEGGGTQHFRPDKHQFMVNKGGMEDGGRVEIRREVGKQLWDLGDLEFEC